MITLQNISKIYELGDGQSLKAVNDVSLKIGDGELAAIIGPSGSGKSTLMHIIGLLDKPTSGKIYIDGGKEISQLSDTQTSILRNEFVGFIFQQFNLLNKLTVMENILLPTVYSRKKLNFDPQDKAHTLLRRFGIDEKAGTFPNKLSGGQQQRVAIARALIMAPQIVLADEPTGNLDTKTGAEILKLLKELNTTDRITIIMVTHDPNIAKQARKVIKIVDGKLTK